MKIVFKNSIPIIVSFKICSFLKNFFGFLPGALALPFFIVVRDETILNRADYINHESIHLRQFVETLVIVVAVVGFIEYLYAIIVLKKTRIQAYYFMAHEQEAHQNDENLQYLKTRKWFSYYKYILPKNKKRMDLINGKRVIF
jgi:hypothetical protein